MMEITPSMAALEAQAAEAHRVHRDIVGMKAHLTEYALLMGNALGRMREGRLYKLLDYDTWESYLGSPELSIRPRTAERMIRVARRWIGELGYATEQLEDVGITKLDLGVGLLEAGEKPQRVLEDARALSSSDLIKQLAQVRGRPEPERSRRYRVWVGMISSARGRKICLTPLRDENGTLASMALDGRDSVEFVGYAEVDVSKLTQVSHYRGKIDCWMA